MTRIAIVEGDGIGHEVIPVAHSALELLHPEYELFHGGCGYGMWERTGCPCADQGDSRDEGCGCDPVRGDHDTPR